MNPRFVSALIVDQDSDSAKNISQLVKGLFNKVFVQTDLKLVSGDMNDIKPSVVLLNLTLSQRAENFELAGWMATLSPVPLLLGYSDSHEPELVAHALESGMQDLFQRPFDEDIIASKINKYIQFEKTLEHDLSYTKLRPALSAKVTFQMKITNIDENGLTLLSPHYISKGTSIALPAGTARIIVGDEKTEFLVSRTWTGDGRNEYYFYAELKTPDEKKTAALRKFIMEKQS